MNSIKHKFLFSAIFAILLPQFGQAQTPSAVYFSRLVVVGDSLSAGFQNFSLLDSQQSHGYASLVAQQAGTKLVLPLVPYPGAPNVLSLTSLGPPPVIGPVSGTLPAIPRDNPLQQPTDLAVPGVTLDQVLNLRPDPKAATPVGQLANIVLGYPSPFIYQGGQQTQVEQAIALHPSAVIAWAGNNDALLPALTGCLSTSISGCSFGLTDVTAFAQDYAQLLDALGATKATLITANIPDVTDAGYFTPVAQFAAQMGKNPADVAEALGVGQQDYLRLPAITLAQQILAGQAPGPLTTCPASLPGLGPSQIPCVLTADQASLLRAQVAAYNGVIATIAAAHGAVLVDIHGLMDRLSSQGIQISGQQFTTGYLGGLFSFDGFHPTNTGYALVANAFIDTINQQLHTAIPDVSVSSIMWLDPFTYLRASSSYF